MDLGRAGSAVDLDHTLEARLRHHQVIGLDNVAAHGMSLAHIGGTLSHLDQPFRAFRIFQQAAGSDQALIGRRAGLYGPNLRNVCALSIAFVRIDRRPRMDE